MKRYVGVAIVLLVVATVINDGGRFLTGYFKIDSVADSAARTAAVEARRNTRDRAGMAAVAYAKENDVELYGYDQEGERVFVWARYRIRGTWFLGPFSAWRADQPLDTPYVLERKAEAVISR